MRVSATQSFFDSGSVAPSSFTIAQRGSKEWERLSKGKVIMMNEVQILVSVEMVGNTGQMPQ